VIRVLHTMSPSARASAMVMISVIILYYPETSGAEATFGTLSSCVERPPELERSFAALTIPSCIRCEGVLQMLL
jgi:hypothetical protein